MRIITSLVACGSLALTLATAQAQNIPTGTTQVAPASRYPATSLGLSLGYGAPYGWGVDVGFMVQPKLDVTVGAGLSITGGKLGVGTRYYFSPERKVSAFAGGNLVYSTGFNHLTITTGRTSYGYYGSGSYYSTNDEVIVNFKSAVLLHLRGGVRWQPVRRFALLGALGYGVVLDGDPVEYVGGNASPDNRAIVRLFSPGGPELSVGVAFGLGPR